MTPRRTLTHEGAQALAEAQAATDRVRDARELMVRLAAARRNAVLRASLGGASYAVIARALGISTANVQSLVAAARADRARK